MTFGRCFEALLAEAAAPLEPPPAFGEELPAPALFAGRSNGGPAQPAVEPARASLAEPAARGNCTNQTKISVLG